jgi:hypothetical protein
MSHTTKRHIPTHLLHHHLNTSPLLLPSLSLLPPHSPDHFSPNTTDYELFSLLPTHSTFSSIINYINK